MGDNARDKEEKKKIQTYNPQQFRDFLGNNKELADEAYKDKALIEKLNKVEVLGYKEVTENFKGQFNTLKWDGPTTEQSRSQEVKDKSGNVIATLTEKTIKSPLVIKNENGQDIKVEGYRSIDSQKS